MKVAMILLILAAVNLIYVSQRGQAQPSKGGAPSTAVDKRIDDNAQQMLAQGRQIFRYDTFGDEVYWTDQLKLHRAIEGSKFGGVGPGVSPKTALSVGLKVDMDALPSDLVDKIKKGQVNLDDPATTLALIKLNSVLGVKGSFNQDGSLKSVGLSCAVCHSTVDNTVAPGIGHRLDGWANRDLNVGAIVSLSPDLSPFTSLLKVDEATVKKVLASWGPGKFDAELNLDGKAFRPDGKPSATFDSAGVWDGGRKSSYVGWRLGDRDLLARLRWQS